MNRTRFLVSLLLGATLIGCDKDPTGPGSEPQTKVTPATLTLTQLGETGSVTATAKDSTTRSPSLSLAREQRWLTERSVLDSTALAAGRIEANAPGTAKLLVRVTYNSKPDTLTVHVRPNQPLVMHSTTSGAVGVGDTLVLRGYRLHEISNNAVTVGSTVASVISKDSATLRLSVPDFQTESCVSGTPREKLAVSGAQVVDSILVARKQKGALSLRVGEALRLTQEQARCLRLPPIANAEYALAHFDSRLTLFSRDGYEFREHFPYVKITTTVMEAGASVTTNAALAPSYSKSVSGRPRSHGHVVTDPVAMKAEQNRMLAASSSSDPTDRTTAYTLGETFPAKSPVTGAETTATVQRIYGDRYVLAFIDDEMNMGQPQRFLTQMDSVMPWFLKHGEPFLQAMFTATKPETGFGTTGQFLMLGGGRTGHAEAVAIAQSKTGYPPSTYHVYSFGWEYQNTADLLMTVSHEMAHSWQAYYMYETRTTRTHHSMGVTWATEGGADFVMNELTRHYLGVPMLANTDWTSWVGKVPNFPMEVWGNRGDWMRGYEHPSAFMRDLTNRLIAAGVDSTDARREVLRGTIEGWYGYDLFQQQRKGLAARVQEHLGADWTPEDAMLRYALTWAVDDLIASPEFNNPTWRNVNGVQLGSQNWTEHGNRFTTRYDGLTSGKLEAIRSKAYAASNGYYYLFDHGYGGAFQLSAEQDGAPLELDWMILRYK